MPPRPNALAESLPATIPFVAPERTERETGRPFRARLGANEGNTGCSPLAIEAMAKAARDEAWKYCDPEAFHLRSALCARLGLSMEEIVCGPGIDNLLGLAVRLFADAGETIVTSLGAYPTFNYHVAGFGRRLVTVPYQDDREDLMALADTARRERARIVYVSNPDNPMGTWWNAAEITAFLDAVPEDCLVLLDEAYGETAPAGTLPPVDTGRPNVLRLRTFSKAHGLAGLRVGHAFGNSALVAPFNKVRDHFGVNVIAQAGAEAALADGEHLAATLARIAAARERIAAIARTSGLAPIPSATNFVTVDCGGDGVLAKAVLDGLMVRGVFVRKPMAPVLDRCIRISAGRDEELDVLAEVLPQALDAARAQGSL